MTQMKKYGKLVLICLAVCLSCLLLVSCQGGEATTTEQPKETLKPSEGLEFIYYKDEDFYQVTDIGSCQDSEVVVPLTYQGKPVTGVTREAFYQCETITSIVLQDGVTEIGDEAFQKCPNLSSVTFPSSLVHIEGGLFWESAYYNDPNNWENGVLYVGQHLINADEAIESCAVKEGTLTIADNAFSHCQNLASITLPESVRNIGCDAFSDCGALESIALPSAVTKIRRGTFQNCEKLAIITIPDSVTDIGSEAFENTAYYNQKSNWKNGVLYIGKCLLTAEDTVTFCVVENGTKGIAKGAFKNCKELKSVILPDGLVHIGEGAFSRCDKLAGVFIPKSVTTIDWAAFFSCDNLVIYCEAKNKPTTWNDGWVGSDARVEWDQGWWYEEQ